jgi:general stress protein 26
MQDEQEKAWKFIEKFRAAMLVTDSDTGPRSRPMNAIFKPDEGVVWFLSEASSAKDAEARAEPRVNLVFSDGGQNHASVQGTATEVADRATVKRLWNAGAQAWWPQGPDDPNIVAIRVTPDSAEIWDGNPSPVAFVKMGIAIATKTVPNAGDHIKTTL